MTIIFFFLKILSIKKKKKKNAGIGQFFCSVVVVASGCGGDLGIGFLFLFGF